MNGAQAALLVAMAVLLAGTGIMSFLGVKIFGKYMSQKTRCTQKTYGKVVGYTALFYSEVLRYPIVEFKALDGKTYRIKGPEYRMHSIVGSPLHGFNVNRNEEKQTISVNCVSFRNDFEYSYGENPMELLYPLDTDIEVFYDPDHPKKGFVKRYCDKRFMFWIFQGTAALIFLMALLMLVLFFIV